VCRAAVWLEMGLEMGLGLADVWLCIQTSYIQKIRPARAPKGPGRPFSSERGTAKLFNRRSDSKSGGRAGSPRKADYRPSRSKSIEQSNCGETEFRPAEKIPSGTLSTNCSAVALALLLGDLLGSLLLLLRHCDGSLQ